MRISGGAAGRVSEKRARLQPTIVDRMKAVSEALVPACVTVRVAARTRKGEANAAA